MLGPTKPRCLDQPIAVSVEDLVPGDNVYRHPEATLDLDFVPDWTHELYAERGGTEPEALPCCEGVGTTTCPMRQPPYPSGRANATLTRPRLMTDPVEDGVLMSWIWSRR
jgi:hypothetical protein